MTLPAISSRVRRRASGWRIATCAPRRVGSRGLPIEQPTAASRAIGEGDRELAEGGALAPDRVDARLGGQQDALLDGRQRKHPGRSGEPLRDARRRIVALGHRELVALPEPALDRVAQPILEGAADVQPGRRAGSAVEELVRAADREVGAARVELDVDRAARVAEVPDDERPGLVGEGGDRVDVGDRGRSVVHVAEGDERDVARMRRQGRGDVVGRRSVDRVGVDPGDLEVPRPGQALQDVAIGREVVPVGHDHAPTRSRLERSMQAACRR